MTKIERVSAEPRWFGLNLTRVRVSSADSQGGFALIEMSGRRYDSPLHVHHHESETHYVLEGVLRVHIPGRSVELHAGDAFCTPRGVPQMYQVVSDTARWLLVMAPGGFDGLVATMSEPAERDEIPPGPPCRSQGRPAGRGPASSWPRDPGPARDDARRAGHTREPLTPRGCPARPRGSGGTSLRPPVSHPAPHESAPITAGLVLVPFSAAETTSAVGFNQVARTIGVTIGSPLRNHPRGRNPGRRQHPARQRLHDSGPYRRRHPARDRGGRSARCAASTSRTSGHRRRPEGQSQLPRYPERTPAPDSAPADPGRRGSAVQRPARPG